MLTKLACNNANKVRALPRPPRGDGRGTRRPLPAQAPHPPPHPPPAGALLHQLRDVAARRPALPDGRQQRRAGRVGRQDLYAGEHHAGALVRRALAHLQQQRAVPAHLGRHGHHIREWRTALPAAPPASRCVPHKGEKRRAGQRGDDLVPLAGRAQMWSAQRHNYMEPLLKLQSHKEPCRCLTMAPTDRKFASASDDSTIKVGRASLSPSSARACLS